MAKVCMTIRDHSRESIEKLARGTEFEVADIYAYVQNRFPQECSRSELTTDGEEKWRKDSRWPLQDLKMKNAVVHIGVGPLRNLETDVKMLSPVQNPRWAFPNIIIGMSGLVKVEE
jgi:hypothetical protein